MKTLIENLNYQPNHLTEDELESPDCAIAQFFDNHPLHVAREKIAKLYQGWLLDHAQDPDTEQLIEMAGFFTKLTELVNLAYVVAYQYDSPPKLA